jgi:hypothetical protein
MDWVAAMEKKRGIRHAELKKKQVRPSPREGLGRRLGLARSGCHPRCVVWEGCLLAVAVAVEEEQGNAMGPPLRAATPFPDIFESIPCHLGGQSAHTAGAVASA